MDRLPQFDAYALPIARIFYDEDFNCRERFTAESVQSLARSIEQIGLEIPVVVQPWTRKPGYDYRLIAGHRRLYVCDRFLKWVEIPARIRENLTDHEAHVLNFTENLERTDLNLWEEARGIANTFPGVGSREIAKQVGKPTRWVLSRLKLLQLPEEVQRQAAAGLLTAANVDVIAHLDTAEAQIRAAQRISQVKAKGKHAPIGHLADECKGKFRHRRTKDQINAFILELFNLGITGGMPRILAWAAGTLQREDLQPDIEERLREQERLKREAGETTDDA